MTPGALNAIVPMACVAAAGIAAMVAEAFREPGERMPIAGLGVVGLLGAAISTVVLWNHNTSSFGLVSADNFGLFVTMILVIIGLLTLAISGPTIERERLPAGEYYALTLFAIAGMMLMATATDLLVIFLALEVLSLAVYVLTGLRRDSPVASEAAFKYFLLGAFSSAFFLYGVAFTYGVTGSTHLDRIGSVIAAGAAHETMMQRLAAGLLMVGFAFKVSAVPFHMWTPDAYEGAPSSVTGFMSTGVKAAAFAAFVRVFLSAFEPMRADWGAVLWVVAAATMVLGTVVGVVQSNVKRMLAYSSIAHAGYLLTALVAGSVAGAAAFLFYLLFYTLMTVGAFAILSLKGRGGERDVLVGDLDGLAEPHPWLALAMTICMLSLLGFPGTAGFIGKWLILRAATGGGYPILAAVLVVTSVVSAGYYLPVVMAMYMKPPAHDQSHALVRVPRTAAITLTVMVAALLVFGLWPNLLLDAARNGSHAFMPQGVISIAAPVPAGN